MITLKEFLAEPQTMYDGGVVQHMSEGGMPLTIVEVPDKPEGIRHLLNDTKFGRSASDPAYITPNQKTMRTYDKKPVSLSLEQLKDIPGASGEERFRADPEAFGGVGKYGPLRESIKRKGYQDYEGNPLTTDPITLEVNSKGEAVIAEGNHRLAEAIESGRDSVPVHIQYYGGSENIEGPYNPDRLQLGPRVLKEGEKGAIRLSPEKFQSLTEQLPEVEQQLSITEQQPSVTKKSTLPVPKRIKEKLLRNIRNFIPLIKAGRSLSPVGIALNLLQIIPEETMNNAVDYLKNTPTHELFGLEKSGLESVEDLWEEVKGHLITQTEPTEITAQYIRNLDLYHATTATKLIGGKLKASKVGVLGQGVYATPDTEYAGGYAEGEGGNIHPVKANIENPLIVRIKGRFHHYTPARVFEELGVSKEKAFEMAERNSEEHGGDFTTQFKSRARKQGYDSIVLVNDETNTMQEIVVFDPDKIVSKFKPMYDGGLVQHMSEGGEPTETLKMSVFDEEYDEYIKNLEGSTSDLFNDNVMRDVLDSFSVSSKSLEEVNPKELSLPIPEKRLDLYKKLELEPPSSKEGALTVGSLDWYKDYNLLAPPMTYEQLLKRRYGLELIDLDWDVSHIIERPSSSTVTEQQLPVTTKPTLPVPKSLESKLPKIVGTILKARKYTNPLGLAAQVLDLIPQETKAAAVDYLKNTPTHELFGLEKSGLESVEDLWEEVKNNLTTETEPYNKEVYHSTSELRWPNIREESGDIPNVNPKKGGSDIGFHVMEKKDLPQYYNVKKYWDEMITMPLKANIRKTIEIPDMSRFRSPKNWIEKMSVDRQVRTDLSEEELKKYFIDTNPKALDKGRMYPKPSVIEKLSNDRKEALKLWKHIVQGASRYAPEFESGFSETSERWINFLRNVLDKTGADAFSYKNYTEGTGELSYMFLDSPETIGKKVKLKHNIEPDPTRPELSKYRGGQIRPMYDGGLVLA